MLKSLKIKNFRCFEEFDLPQLGRVNLLVGKNNSGKTSILEAVDILTARSIKPFFDILRQRQEYTFSVKDPNTANFDSTYLVHGYPGFISTICDFEISGIDDKNGKVKFSSYSTEKTPNQLVENAKKENRKIQIINLDSSKTIDSNSTILEWTDIEDSIFLIFWPGKAGINLNPQERIPGQFISLNSSNLNVIINQFNEIVLTPKEEILYESLRIIESGIERIAPISSQGYRETGNGGFLVSINKNRIPIGNMGYGFWRILEITLAMLNIPGKTLLIDEIDTGLHFSVMIDLWKLICKTAEKLDIQVFATTHNSDCWKSLAEVANSDDITNDDITIHRIERGKKASVVFNEQEMAIAAERDIEVR